MLEKTDPRMAPRAPATAPEESDEIDIFAILRTLWRGKWVIVVCTILAVLLGGYYAYRVAVPMFAAQTTLALQLREQNPVDFESVVTGVTGDWFAMNTELEVLTSRRLSEEVVKKLNLTEDPQFNWTLRPEPGFSLRDIPRAAIDLLRPAEEIEEPAPITDEDILAWTTAAVQSTISPSILTDTYVFRISVTTQDPDTSVAIANTLAQTYIDDQIRVKFEATEGAVSWLSDRVVELEGELRRREDEISAVMSDADFVSPEQLNALNVQARDIRQRLEQQRGDADRAMAKVQELEVAREINDIEGILEITEDPTLRRLAQDFEPGAEIAEGSTFAMRFDTLLGRARLEAERAMTQADALADSLARLESRIADQTDGLVELQQMQRDLDATSVLYETFLTRLKEISVQQGIQQADSRVLSEATEAWMVAPRKGRILTLSFLLGGMIGCAIVLLYEATRRGFRTTEALETVTGQPVIGQIPRIPIRKRETLVDYLNDKPTSAAAEAVRNLRTSVLLSNIDRPPQVLMSTSSIPGEGKTTQAIALAHNLAGLGKKVLLMEGDVRRRTFTQYFGLCGLGGVLSVISGEVPLEDAIVRSPGLQADILMGEKSNINAADVFSSERFRELMAHLRELYDFIIIDTPPVLVVPDARVIGQHADAIIYNVSWDSTTKGQVVDGLRELAGVNLRVAGLVLSQIDPKGMRRYGYGGRYGAYSRYGNDYYEI